MTDLSTVLDEIEARADAATPGPWEHSGLDEHGNYFVRDTEYPSYRVCADAIEEDVAFIAAARSDVPRLVAALRAVLDLHRPLNDLGSPPCATCLGDEDGESVFVLWPCPTVRAITSALTGEVGR